VCEREKDREREREIHEALPTLIHTHTEFGVRSIASGLRSSRCDTILGWMKLFNIWNPSNSLGTERERASDRERASEESRKGERDRKRERENISGE